VRDIAIGEEITIDYRRLESRFDRAPRRTKSSSDLSGGPREPPLSDSTPGGVLAVNQALLPRLSEVRNA